MNLFDPGYFTSDELRQTGFARVGESCAIARNCTIIAPLSLATSYTHTAG